ncbi:MAG TPA: transporter substrate-binding domain-containing protein [Candidatus Limiplasma stercoravium]|nr:transporter substrate-binding domain-containing protein [Candidatus Limiplasma stercoravium]
MKKTISLLLLLLLALSACCASAQEDDARIAEHSIEAIQQRGTLLVAIQTDNSKMSYWVPEGIEEFADRAGEPSGYVPLLCQQLAEDMGVTLEFVPYDLTEQQIEAAEKGEADISANVWSITEDRLERYTMTENILVTGIEGDEVFLRADPERPGSPLIDSEEALGLARIGAVKATVQVDNTRLQYPEAEVVAYADNDAVLEALLEGEVDAAVFTTFDKTFADILVQAIVDQQICQCDYEIANPEIKGVGFILMKGNDELCDFINDQLTLYRNNGFLQELNDLSESEARAMGII